MKIHETLVVLKWFGIVCRLNEKLNITKFLLVISYEKDLDWVVVFIIIRNIRCDCPVDVSDYDWLRKKWMVFESELIVQIKCKQFVSMYFSFVYLSVCWSHWRLQKCEWKRMEIQCVEEPQIKEDPKWMIEEKKSKKNREAANSNLYSNYFSMMKTLNTRLYVNTDHLWMRCEIFWSLSLWDDTLWILYSDGEHGM